MGKYSITHAKMKLRDCVPTDYNPRRISDGEFRKLVRSIEHYGYRDPIIVNERNNHIVAGNQRFKALELLNKRNHGKYTVIDVVLVDMDLDDEKSFCLTHNKVGGEFDDDMVQEIMSELEAHGYDTSLTGFFEEEEEAYNDDDLDEFIDDEDDELVPSNFSVGQVEYVLTVKLPNKAQSDFLFNELRSKGYNVKATQY